MKLTLNYKLGGILIVMFITIMAIVGFSTKVFGNVSYFAPSAQTGSSNSTSTPVFLTVGGLATTTPVVYDSYGIDGTNEFAGQTSDASDSASILEYVQASTTATVFKTWVEYSDGVVGVSCSTNQNACDWYENNLDTYAAGNIAIVAPNTYSWAYASTTMGGTISTAGQNRGAKIIGLKVPTRYARAYVSVTGANGSVYLKWVPKKQRVN